MHIVRPRKLPSFAWACAATLVLIHATETRADPMLSSGQLSIGAQVDTGFGPNGEIFGAGIIDTADGAAASGALTFVVEYEPASLNVRTYSSNAGLVFDFPTEAAKRNTRAAPKKGHDIGTIDLLRIEREDLIFAGNMVGSGELFEIAIIGIGTTANELQTTGFAQVDDVPFEIAFLDADGDGVNDGLDNCISVANPAQEDSNNDDIGNICDADITGPGDVEDCRVNFLDLRAVKNAFFSTPTSPSWNPHADLDSNGNVNFADLRIVKQQFLGPPGPSANGCN